jgi:bifunctional DNA-binding transcriptional regulator/antitoxin component of YhaV-PrlF toxin-antitoxin module
MTTRVTLTVTAKGQVTLRQSVLRHLGIRPGDAVAVDLGPSGSATLCAAPRGEIADFFGCLPPPPRRRSKPVSVEEMNEAVAEGWAGRARR